MAAGATFGVTRDAQEAQPLVHKSPRIKRLLGQCGRFSTVVEGANRMLTRKRDEPGTGEGMGKGEGPRDRTVGAGGPTIFCMGRVWRQRYQRRARRRRPPDPRGEDSSHYYEHLFDKLPSHLVDRRTEIPSVAQADSTSFMDRTLRDSRQCLANLRFG